MKNLEAEYNWQEGKQCGQIEYRGTYDNAREDCKGAVDVVGGKTGPGDEKTGGEDESPSGGQGVRREELQDTEA